MASLTFWTRLEPFARLGDIEAGLQARVHDPLWLLARQWQTGEFGGEDAATPVQARARVARMPLARFHAGPVPDGQPFTGEPYRGDLPLETLVEREPVALATDPRRDRRLAAEAGLMFLRILTRAGASAATRAAYVAEPAFRLAAGGEESDPAGDGYLAIMAGRVPDGFRLYEALVASLRPPAGGAPRLPARPPLAADERARALAAAQAFVGWYEARYSTPPAGAVTAPAWVSERMEYSFAVSAAVDDGEIVLSAPEHAGDPIDWHSFDINLALTTNPQAEPKLDVITRTVMPTPVRYPGMAADRWWQFEDARVNFNRIDGDPDDLVRMLLIDFALLYSNDWYVVPLDASPGALYHLESLVVTDAFGERTLVPHYSETAAGSPDWRMYAVSPSDDLLFLPPVLATSLHGEPLEEVVFARDELTNLVWAVEQRVPSLGGGSLDREAQHRRRGADPAPAVAESAGDPELRYRLATTVPAHWIPFQPVRPDDASPAVRLRRVAALLDLSGEPGLSRPLGRILEPDRDLSLCEEEVPRSGLRVVRRFEYARWVDGSTHLWLSRRKGVGRGEGSSGLAFDTLEDA